MEPHAFSTGKENQNFQKEVQQVTTSTINCQGLNIPARPLIQVSDLESKHMLL